MAINQTYSFLDVVAAIAGPGGTFSLGNEAGPSEEGISIASTGEIDGMQIGADGSGQHSLYADHSGKVTVRMLKTSPQNQLLSAMFSFQTASASTHGQNTISVLDIARGDVITCEQVAFAKAPDLNYGKEAGMVEWDFNAVKITRTLG